MPSIFGCRALSSLPLSLTSPSVYSRAPHSLYIVRNATSTDISRRRGEKGSILKEEMGLLTDLCITVMAFASAITCADSGPVGVQVAQEGSLIFCPVSWDKIYTHLHFLFHQPCFNIHAAFHTARLLSHFIDIFCFVVRSSLVVIQVNTSEYPSLFTLHCINT